MKTGLTAVMTIAAMALALPSDLVASPDGDNAKVYSEVGMQLRSEAGLTEDRDLKNGLLLQSGEAFLRSADNLSSEQAQKALVEAIESLSQARGDDALARIISVTFVIERRFPGTEAAAKALVARGGVYAEQKEWGRAVSAWMKVHKDHPTSEAAPEALYKSGKIFVERIRNAEEAAKAFSTIFKDYPRSSVADDALFARAQVRENGKEYAEAVTDYLSVSEKYPDSNLADKAMYSAIYICDRYLKDFKKAHDLSVQFRKIYPHSEFLKKVESIEQKTLKYVG